MPQCAELKMKLPQRGLYIFFGCWKVNDFDSFIRYRECQQLTVQAEVLHQSSLRVEIILKRRAIKWLRLDRSANVTLPKLQGDLRDCCLALSHVVIELRHHFSAARVGFAIRKIDLTVDPVEFLP